MVIHLLINYILKYIQNHLVSLLYKPKLFVDMLHENWRWGAYSKTGMCKSILLFSTQQKILCTLHFRSVIQMIWQIHNSRLLALIWLSCRSVTRYSLTQYMMRIVAFQIYKSSHCYFSKALKVVLQATLINVHLSFFFLLLSYMLLAVLLFSDLVNLSDNPNICMSYSPEYISLSTLPC